MVTRHEIDGSGTVFVDDAGGVRIVLSEPGIEMFDRAVAKAEMSDDELVARLLDAAEQGRSEAGTCVLPVESSPAPIQVDERMESPACRRPKRYRVRARHHARYS